MKKFLIIGIVIILILTSCTTTKYIYAELPEYRIELPSRPEITEKSDDIIKLMRYAEELEIDIITWNNYYEGMRRKANE